MSQGVLAGTATDRALTQRVGRMLGRTMLLASTVNALYRSVLRSWVGDLWIDPKLFTRTAAAL